MFIIKEYSIIDDGSYEPESDKLVNTYEVDGLCLFVYDGCHKIYIVEDNDDIESVKESWGEDTIFYNIDELQDIWDNSCQLRFISNWKLDKQFVRQFYNAEFELY